MHYHQLCPLAATGILTAGIAMAIEDRPLELPADYRTAFDNYMISDRLGQEDQVISLYAAPETRAAIRDNGSIPEGAVIVGELYGVKTDGDGAVVESMLGRRIPTDLKAIVVMERRDAWAEQYSDELKLDGWEFEVFSPAGENLNKDTTACRECHAPHGDTDYLFSRDHIAARN